MQAGPTECKPAVGPPCEGGNVFEFFARLFREHGAPIRKAIAATLAEPRTTSCQSWQRRLCSLSISRPRPGFAGLDRSRIEFNAMAVPVRAAGNFHGLLELDDRTHLPRLRRKL
jgi:hypothetical protein